MKKISYTESLLSTTLNELVKSLQEGHSDQYHEYLNFCAKFHNYSFNNRLLIALQMPTASKVAGKYTWLKLSRTLKEGATPLKILMPILVNKKDKYGNKTEEKWLRGYKETYVYDIVDTEGDNSDLSNYMQGVIISGNDHKTNYDYIVQVMTQQGITVIESDLGIHCFLRGRSFGGKVEINKHLPYNHKLKTLIHEWCHELLHQGSENLNISKNLKEFEAESTAYIVCKSLGLDATTSKDYIVQWMNDEEFDQKKFSKNMDRVIKASDLIIHIINESLGQDVLENNQEDLKLVA